MLNEEDVTVPAAPAEAGDELATFEGSVRKAAET
jgi:hypothetical protein